MARASLALALSTVIACLATFGPASAADAQQPARMPRIAFINPGLASNYEGLLDAFRQGLRERGYVEGKNIAIDYRFFPLNREEDLLPQIASELAAANVDLILAGATTTIRAVKAATNTIPIIMVGAGDPVGNGFVASLGRPGGNVTGLTSMSELAGKRLQLLKDLAPKASRVALLWNSTNAAQARAVREAESAARAMGVALHSVDVRTPSDFDSAFSAMATARDEALMVEVTPLIGVNRLRVADLALKSRLPAIYSYRFLCDAGGLMCYGPNLADLYRRAAIYVDKILKGANPADLPVEQLTKFELIVNLKTAKALGLTFPESILVQADEVIK